MRSGRLIAEQINYCLNELKDVGVNSDDQLDNILSRHWQHALKLIRTDWQIGDTATGFEIAAELDPETKNTCCPLHYGLEHLDCSESAGGNLCSKCFETVLKRTYTFTTDGWKLKEDSNETD